MRRKHDQMLSRPWRSERTQRPLSPNSELRLRRWFFLLALGLSQFLITNSQVSAQSDEDLIREELTDMFGLMREYTSETSPANVPTEAFFDISAICRSVSDLASTNGKSDSTTAELALLGGVLRQGLVGAIQSNADSWDRLKLERLELSDRNRRVVLTLRTWNQTGVTYRQRYWLTKQDDEWRIIDVEDLGLGVRMSRTLGKLYRDLQAESDSQVALLRVRVIEVTSLAVAGGNISIAFDALNRLDESSLPEEVLTLRLVLSGAGALRNDDPEGALEIYDEAARLNIEIPLLKYNRSVALNRLGRAREALESAREFVELYGDDADAQLEIGKALATLGQDSKAIEAFRVGLDDTPNMVDNLVSLGLILPIDQKEEVTDRFLKLAQPQVDFEEIAIAFNDAGDMDALAALVQGLMEVAPTDPNAAYYGALVLYDNERYDEAVELLIPALPRAPEDEAQYYREVFLDCCLEAGRPIFGYDNVADKRAAFDYLGRELNYRGQADLVQTLITRHAAADPLDRNRWYIEGDRHFFLDDFASADQAYQRVGDEVSAELKEEVRFSRVICWYNLGKGLEAVTKFAPFDASFGELAEMYYRDQDAAGMKSLIAAHQDNSNEPDVFRYWKAYSHYLSNEYSQAATFAKNWVNEFEDASDPETVSQMESVWMRSLVRTQKYDEAMIVAKQSTARDGDPYFEAVVWVAKGELDSFKRVALDLFENGYDPETLLEDEDISPLLEKRSELKPFADWLNDKIDEYSID